MPASPRPKRLHYWGSNALIYIAQECTTRGLRCLHLHVQEHNSRCARRHVIRASKNTRVATSCAHPRDTRVGLLARVQEDARVGHVIRAFAYGARPKMPALDTSSPRWSLAQAKDGRVYFDACKDA